MFHTPDSRPGRSVRAMARACCISARTTALSPASASAFTLAFAFLFAMAPAQPLRAATVVTPYFQDFEGYADGASSTVFTENNGAAYVVLTDTGGDRAFRGRVATSSTPASAAVQVTDAGGKDFTISSTLRLSELDAGTNTGMNFSLAAAGTDATFANSEYRLQLNFVGGSGPGTVALYKNGAAQTFTSFTNPTGDPLLIDVGTLYTASMSAVYSSPTDAVLTLTVSDGTNTFTGIFEDTSALTTGTNFGYRIAKNTTSGSIGVFADDFSLNVVPEPSRALLLLGGLFALLTHRRRR